MKTTIVRGASGAYAHIETPTCSAAIRLHDGISAHSSLQHTAKELRQKAERLLRRAEMAEQAAGQLATAAYGTP